MNGIDRMQKLESPPWLNTETDLKETWMKHRVVPIPSRGLRIKSRRRLGGDAVVLKSDSNTKFLLKPNIWLKPNLWLKSSQIWYIEMKETLSKGTMIFPIWHEM